MLAASPAAYSSLEPRDVGPLRVISLPRSQAPCATCTAFAVATAAEAAVATALGRDVRDVGRLSTQDLHFCGPKLRACESGATLSDALEQLKARRLVLEDCLPYRPPEIGGLATKSQMCAKACSDASPLAVKGAFDYVPIAQLWTPQKFIRERGAVVTRFNIYSDFKPFFRDPRNKGNVYRPFPGPGNVVEEQHAIALVGYNNEKQFWIARNSWGLEFADEGNFRVAFGVAGVLNPDDTYGIVFTPSPGQRPPPLTLVSTPGLAQGCSHYTVGPSKRTSCPALRAVQGCRWRSFLLTTYNQLQTWTRPWRARSCWFAAPRRGCRLQVFHQRVSRRQALLRPGRDHCLWPRRDHCHWPQRSHLGHGQRHHQRYQRPPHLQTCRHCWRSGRRWTGAACSRAGQLSAVPTAATAKISKV
ncbi:MAG: hypothetical protein J3K34DRAFT_100057 [Monoraphidium minutum]|nr:MAG: hypothetical protein J3K34DRAFT_100057 [Monoraphidium minutum]